MIRIAGILCGSAIAISLMIFVLGIPEIMPDSIIEAADTEAQPVPEPAVDATHELSAGTASKALPEPNIDEVATQIPPEQSPHEVLSREPIEQWYAFWSPFRSELAANGFMSQLQQSTSIDYRVVRLQPGVFEVAFAYDTDADIDAKLAEISAATGLDMPDG